MAKVSLKILISASAAIIFSLPAFANGIESESDRLVKSDTIEYANPHSAGTITIKEETTVITQVYSDGRVITETINGPVPEDHEIGNQSLDADDNRSSSDSSYKLSDAAESRRKAMSRFTAGIELGTGLDISGNDLSTFNFDLLFGYRHKAIQLLGVNIGVHKSLGSRDSYIPICAVIRTSFRPKPSLMFLHFSAGYSFNTISNSPMFGDITATLGCGINLVQRTKFQSNIIMAFGFRHLNTRHQELTRINQNNVGFAQISFGISM